MAFPAVFAVGGPSQWLVVTAATVFAVGLVGWAWSVLVLLTTTARAGRLVTTGPYLLVCHPLYTSVALLVLPGLGLLSDTWLGAAVGLALYVASRLFAPDEEVELAERFGPQWDAYRRRVKVGWL